MMMIHSTGDQVDQRTPLRCLAELQYTRNDLELHRAIIRVRETSLMSTRRIESEARRIELFDDEIDSLSWFDPDASASAKVPRATIYPKTHYATPRQIILDATESINRSWRNA